MDAQLLTNTAAVLVAAIALVYTAINTHDQRRNSEIFALFDIWSRYEAYCEELNKSASGPQLDQERHALNLLNFIENVCYISNHRRANGYVTANARAIAADFIALTSQTLEFDALLRIYGIDAKSFSEIREFCHKNQALLEAKGFTIKGSAYDLSSPNPPADPTA